MSLITFEVPFTKNTYFEEINETCDVQELNKIKDKLLLYSLIIKRHSDKIIDNEKKSISQLKMMVNPENEVVIKKVNEIKEMLMGYDYTNDYPKAVPIVIDYIKKIKTIQSPVTFWVSFDEMDKHKIGDDMDKALLLCSILIGLGARESKIIIDIQKKPYVTYDHDGSKYLLSLDDLNPKLTNSLELWTSNSNKFIYSFNNKEYDDLRNEE